MNINANTTMETAMVIHILGVTNLIIRADDKAEQANEINILSIVNIPYRNRVQGNDDIKR